MSPTALGLLTIDLVRFENQGSRNTICPEASRVDSQWFAVEGAMSMPRARSALLRVLRPAQLQKTRLSVLLGCGLTSPQLVQPPQSVFAVVTQNSVDNNSSCCSRFFLRHCFPEIFERGKSADALRSMRSRVEREQKTPPDSFSA